MIASLVESCQAHRDRWQQAKQTYPTLALSAHQALRALDFEEKAERVLAHTRPATAVDAYSLCDVLADLARALEAWAYVSARLWHLCETGQADAEIKSLHTTSCDHYRRLLIRHLQVQQQTFIFCEHHQVILRFGIVTQALDVSDQIQETNTKTGVSLQEIPTAQWGDI
jgi:hypothetical protein